MAPRYPRPFRTVNGARIGLAGRRGAPFEIIRMLLAGLE
jgi:hypothetical protein